MAVDRRAYAGFAVRGRALGARALARALTPAGGLAAVTLLFLAISAWWIAVDTRVLNADSARAMQVAFNFDGYIRAGDLGSIITQSHLYPPLAPLVGAVATLIGGLGVDGPLLAENLVFVPLLALGCYGAGRVVAGPWAGVLAAVFALGAPLVIAQSHVFMLDLPLAAMTATTVWLVLASERFARRPYALAAGFAIALGLLTKATFPMFVIGFLLVVLLRGGWRNPVGLLLCAAAPVALAVPWYANHFDELHSTLRAAQHGVAGGYSPTGRRHLWTLRNFGWYGWAMVNLQLLLPLTLLFLAGAVQAAVRFIRARRPDDYTPELLAGAAVGWVLVSVSLFHDLRYTLPIVVYAAVLGTAWIVRAPRNVGVAAAAVLVLAFAVNTTMVNLRAGSPVRISLPSSTGYGVWERKLTLATPEGFLVNKPYRHQHILELMHAVRAAGARQIYFDGPSTQKPPFEAGGLTVLARLAGLATPPGNDASKLGPRDVVMLRINPALASRPPCDRLADGSGVYLIRGYPTGPFETQPRYCPPGFGGRP